MVHEPQYTFWNVGRETSERCTLGFEKGWRNPARRICICSFSQKEYLYLIMQLSFSAGEDVEAFSLTSLLPISSLQPGWQGLILGPICHLLAGSTVGVSLEICSYNFASFCVFIPPFASVTPVLLVGHFPPSVLHLGARTLVSVGTVEGTNFDVSEANLHPCFAPQIVEMLLNFFVPHSHLSDGGNKPPLMHCHKA